MTDNDDEDTLPSHTTNPQSSTPLNPKRKEALDFSIKALLKHTENERVRILTKLMNDYGDRFYTEGMSDYMKKREELDDIYHGQVQKWADEKIKQNKED